MFNKILVVCVGNICRSPTGEALLKQLVPECEVRSAGVQAVVGIARKYGVEMENHIARQLDAAMCHEADLILVMESGHIRAVDKICPTVRGKVMLFGQWLSNKEIADPYRKSDEMFELVYQQIEAAAQRWAEKLH
ncbi:MAG TPA: low molecular weight protein-tyrosine-phosphatase [Acinetobacter johnsonii]|nr:low molecular weight protein-tyrosine-phosphatase [Acinetobacter johnsonii]